MFNMLPKTLLVALCLSTTINAMALPTPLQTQAATKVVDPVVKPEMFPLGDIDEKAKRNVAAPQNSEWPFGYVDKKIKRDSPEPDMTAVPDTLWPFGYVDKRADKGVAAVSASQPTPSSNARFPFGYVDKQVKRDD